MNKSRLTDAHFLSEIERKKTTWGRNKTKLLLIRAGRVYPSDCNLNAHSCNNKTAATTSIFNSTSSCSAQYQPTSYFFEYSQALTLTPLILAIKVTSLLFQLFFLFLKHRAPPFLVSFSQLDRNNRIAIDVIIDSLDELRRERERLLSSCHPASPSFAYYSFPSSSLPD